MRMTVRVMVVALMGALLAGCAAAPQMVHSSAVATGTPEAAPVAPDRRIGALFVGGGDLHACTAAVLDSPSGDLILTAAHCLDGGADANFAAGFAGVASADDLWHVDAVYLDPRWSANQNPRADFAIARVSRAGGGSLAASVGGGLRLGTAPASGTDVAVTGYPMGVGGGPIGCRGTTSTTKAGFPLLRCGGLVDGTSGSPWLVGSTITGLTGGLDGGGCAENLSYSPPFDEAPEDLLVRAEARGPGDQTPDSSEVDC